MPGTRKPLVIVAIIAAAFAARYAASALIPHTELPVVDVPSAASVHAAETAIAGLCPWRDPSGDRARFFPGSDAVRDELLITSDRRVELARRLGRQPTGEEYALTLHRVLSHGQTAGTIVTRRVKGEYGLIELVIATDPTRRVAGVRLQRQREPEEVAKAVQSPQWLGSLNGKTATAEMRLGSGVPAVPTAARVTATAILDAVRTTLVMMDVAQR